MFNCEIAYSFAQSKFSIFSGALRNFFSM